MFNKKLIGFFIAAACLLYCNCAIGGDGGHPLGVRIKPPQSQSAQDGAKVPIGPTAIYRNVAELPDIYHVYAGYMAEIPFDRRHREIAILVVAREWDSQYEWWAHESRAREAGISDEVIEAIRSKQVPVFDKPDEKIIYDYAHEMVTLHRVSDETYKKAWDLLDTTMLIKLTMLIGHYCGVAVTLNAHELAIPDGSKDPLPIIP